LSFHSEAEESASSTVIPQQSGGICFQHCHSAAKQRNLLPALSFRSKAKESASSIVIPQQSEGICFQYLSFRSEAKESASVVPQK
jgi:hypothetical protein